MCNQKQIRVSLLSRCWFALWLALGLTACAPQVYIIDRNTLMEEESAGEWPDLESQWKAAHIRRAPHAQKSRDSSEKQKALTRFLSPDRMETESSHETSQGARR